MLFASSIEFQARPARSYDHFAKVNNISTKLLHSVQQLLLSGFTVSSGMKLDTSNINERQ